jgi:hypothetical protein
MIDWDRPLALRWVIGLATGCLLPTVIPGLFGGTRWVWVWDVIGKAPPAKVLMAVLPLGLAVGVFAVLHSESGRVRGLLVLVLAVASLLVPVFLSDVGDLLMSPWAFLTGGVQRSYLPLAFVVAAAAVAAGNRGAKGELRKGPSSYVAGLGGLTLITCYFVPVLDKPLVGLLLSGETWRAAWWLALWLLALFLYAGLGAILIVPLRTGHGLRELAHAWISRLARILAWSLPLLVIAFVMAGGEGAGAVYVLLMLLKAVLVTYGIVMLMAIGLARLLQGDPVLILQEDALADPA